MSGRAGPGPQFLLLGMSHHTAPLALRERYAVADPRPALARLLAAPEIQEALLLSTCNRVEALVWTADAGAASGRLRGFFEEALARQGAAVPPGALSAALYEARDAEAVRRFFRVASSLDSMVVGEPQILGQVKDAYRAALASGACGPMLGRLCQHAFATAKRVRSETRIAEGPVSLARVAVQLAGQIFESLAGKTALLVGAGEMIELALDALDALQSRGLAAVSVANRTLARASALAARFGVSAHDLDELPALLGQADILITCIDGELSAAQLAAALRARSRPIFAVDLGVPRNIPAAPGGGNGAGEGADIYVYDLDDLQRLVERNTRGRGRELERAEGIVAGEQRRFAGWLAAQAAVPTIRALRARAEAVRQAEIERALAGGGGSRESLDAVTRAVVNKLLHAPLARLRAEGEAAAGPALLEAARALFDLDSAAAADSPPDAAAPEPADSESAGGAEPPAPEAAPPDSRAAAEGRAARGAAEKSPPAPGAPPCGPAGEPPSGAAGGSPPSSAASSEPPSGAANGGEVRGSAAGGDSPSSAAGSEPPSGAANGGEVRGSAAGGDSPDGAAGGAASAPGGAGPAPRGDGPGAPEAPGGGARASAEP